MSLPLKDLKYVSNVYWDFTRIYKFDIYKLVFVYLRKKHVASHCADQFCENHKIIACNKQNTWQASQ